MKKSLQCALALGIAGAAGVAHADWLPRIQSDTFVATVTMGGSATAIAENARAGGPLGQLASGIAAIPAGFESAIGGFMARKAGALGVDFRRGRLDGSLALQYAPQGDGTALVTVSGIAYSATLRKRGHQYGIPYTCDIDVALDNLAIRSRVALATGAPVADGVSVSASPRTSASCDTAISWIPLIGNLADNMAESMARGEAQDGMRNAVVQMQSMLAGGGGNPLAGLARVVPVGLSVPGPDGRPFPLGQYLAGNLPYLAMNGQFSVQLGQRLQVDPVRGSGEPWRNDFSGTVLSMSLSAPTLSFALQLREDQHVDWRWQCSIADPLLRCAMP